MFFWISLILFLFCSCGKNEADLSSDMDSNSMSFLDSIPDVGFIQRQPHFGDLDSMIQRRFIRVLVPNNRTHYFLDGNRQRGLVYEYMVTFEKYLNKKLKRSTDKIRLICIPVRRDQLIPQLIDGYGDIVAAGLTRTEDRAKLVNFSIPIASEVNEVVVSWKMAPPIYHIWDLSDKLVFVRKSSTYFRHLQQLNLELDSLNKPPVRIKLADENLETEDILELVNNGHMHYTIADDYLANTWSKVLDSIVISDSIPLYKGGSIANAVRKDSPELKNELDKFIKSHNQGSLFGNVVLNRYLRDNQWINSPKSSNIDAQNEKLIKLFKTYGDKYNLDYIFLIALAYQESHLNQKARSRAGAVGIMQVRPSTAAAAPIKIKEVTKLENNIHAGTKYLRHLMDIYFSDPELKKSDRMYFTMAAYNAGPSRISNIRKRAAAHGYDPNQWFNNVEILVAKDVGREPIRYIENILKNYIVFSMIKERITMKKKALDKIE